MNEQPSLPGANPRRSSQLDDFVGLFGDRVFPTPVRLLEQGDAILVVRHYTHNANISRAQDRLFRLLVRHGQSPDAPGSITVVCVWGINVTGREMVVYDHVGVSARQAVSTEEFREWCLAWWRANRGRR